MSGRVSFVADLVRSRAEALQRSAHDVTAADAPLGQESGVPELRGVDAAFSDVGAAVGMLCRSTGEALAAAGDHLADALAEMISVEQDIVDIIARVLGGFS
ncbi:hypothetical protein GCM10009786_02990 [Leucobacter alluvii]|uniref:Excreted virulence factor EspC (Type VII ESX diderm) n=1 Tax=Leucobacter alluvii TaxID=340321 RepID=A0ABN3B286_9MICO